MTYLEINKHQIVQIF